MSFNRMVESTASELQSVGLNPRHNIALSRHNGIITIFDFCKFMLKVFLKFLHFLGNHLTAGSDGNRTGRDIVKYSEKSISNTKEKSSAENINSTSLMPSSGSGGASKSGAALVDRKKKQAPNATSTIQIQARNRRKSSTEK